MKYFKNYFTEVDNWGAEEVKVLCPFHDDTNPSASVNTEKEVFHCWVCGTGYTEVQFISKINGIKLNKAIQLFSALEGTPDISKWEINKAKLWSNSDLLSKAKETLHISDSTVEQLNIGVSDAFGNKFIAIPVIINNGIFDVRELNILKIKDYPKVMGQEDSMAGLVIPYNELSKGVGPIYLCEGEKDMLIAREQGLNAYCLTGGASATINSLCIHAFKNKDVIVCYDNDSAGLKGVSIIKKQLDDIAKSVKHLDMSMLVKKEHEDVFDYFVNYGGDIFEFMSQPLKEIEVPEVIEQYTTITEALKKDKLKKEIKSIVTVTSEYSDTYAVPTYVEALKTGEDNSAGESMVKGEKRTWSLSDNKPNQLLELIEVDAKKGNISGKLLSFLGLDKKEKNIKITAKYYTTIYKTAVIDKDVATNPSPIDLYSFDKLDVGKQYEITHIVTNHPSKNQKLVSVANTIKEFGSVSNFKPIKELLQPFKRDGDIKTRVEALHQSAKHHVAKHLSFNTWFMTDLVINSILDFNYGEKMRGALDIFILGDTQVGKSETVTMLTNLYKFGTFLSLKTSSTVGLIGGSNKVDGSWCNTIGAIPRQHEKLVALEEFSGAKQDFIKTMTDIRSSNELRIARASGELRVPCKLRMITLSNPVNDMKGNPKNLETFPNGVLPITELITSSEDVARYDGFLLVPRIEQRFNPHSFTLDNKYYIKNECYEHKAQWVFTRKPENVIFEDGIESYIWEKGEYLNQKFECDFSLFTTTTSKKLARFCVACASLIMSTSEDMENIIVTKEIVDYMTDFLEKIYTAEPFNLASYKKEYDSYNVYTQKDIEMLEKFYPANATLIETLSKTARTNRNTMRTVSGLDGDKFNGVFNMLVANKYIKLDMDNVTPTLKFRKCYTRIDKYVLDPTARDNNSIAPIDLTRKV